MRRTVAVLSALVLVLLASVPASGAGPTLGGAITPATVILEKGRAVTIENRSTVPVSVTVEADQPGWEFDVSTFNLNAGASQSVNITKASADAARISAHLVPLGFVGSGMDTTSLTLGNVARHWTFMDEWGWLILPVGVALGFAIGVLLMLIRRRWST